MSARGFACVAYNMWHTRDRVGGGLYSSTLAGLLPEPAARCRRLLWAAEYCGSGCMLYGPLPWSSFSRAVCVHQQLSLPTKSVCHCSHVAQLSRLEGPFGVFAWLMCVQPLSRGLTVRTPRLCNMSVEGSYTVRRES
jgi:hypothetical protein